MLLQLVHFETIISCMVDEFPLLRKNHRVRAIFSGCTAAALFLIGILFITRVSKNCL
jgi:predicted tellurium resistance membrane protein TerC